MSDPYRETEYRLRELNGVLDLAVCLAIDVIREHDSHGLSEVEWQRRLIDMAARKLTDARQFGGRFSLFTDAELHALDEQLIRVGGGNDSVEREALSGEVEFELARRGIGRFQAGDAVRAVG